MQPQIALYRNVDANYFPSVTMLRACAILLVFGYHFVPLESVQGIPVIQWLVAFGFSGVDVFFIISGFIIPYTMWKADYRISDFFRFFGRRLLRLHPPYLASIAFAVLIEVAYNAWYNYPYSVDWPRVGVHSIYWIEYSDFVSYNVVYWTLVVELQFYFLMALAFPLLMHRNKIFMWIFLAAFAIGGILVDYIAKEHIFRHVPMFIAGILLFEFGIRRINTVEFSLAMTALVVLSYFDMGLFAVFVTVPTVLIILFFSRKWLVTEFFGKISYSFYLTHCLVAGWFYLFWKDSFPNDFWARFTAFVLCVIIAALMYYGVERPAIRLASLVKLNKRKKPLPEREPAGSVHAD